MITRHKPWLHQQAAYDFVCARATAGADGAYLAMDPGTGKTKPSIDLIQNHPIKRILIACPKGVIDVWTHEIAKHAADPEAFGIAEPWDGSGRVEAATSIAAALFNRAKHKVFIGNYDFLWRDPFRSWALTQRWDLVITDEAHRLKSAGGKASGFFKTLRARAGFCLGLSGTPMPHSPLDLYAQMRFIDPRLFGTSVARFKQQYCFIGGFDGRQIVGWQHLDELHAKFYEAAFRVTDEVLDLPKQVDEFRTTTLEARAYKHYKELQKDFMTATEHGLITVKNALVKMLRLQQLAGGWLKHEDKTYEQVSRAKLDLLVETISDLPKEEPLVIFCRFHHEMDAVMNLLRSRKRPVAEVSGRQDQLKHWQAGTYQDIVVQIQKTEGTDFTRARYGIYYSQGLSLGNYDQSRKRIRRPGQVRSQTFIHLLVKGTVDEKIYRTFAKNEDVIQAVLRDGL